MENHTAEFTQRSSYSAMGKTVMIMILAIFADGLMDSPCCIAMIFLKSISTMAGAGSTAWGRMCIRSNPTT